MRIFIKTILLLLAVSVLHFAGVFFGVYDYQIQQGNVWFDNILHVLDGAIFAYAWMEFNKKKVLLTSTLIFVFIFAVGWEVIEYGFMKLIPSQALDLKIYSPSIWEAAQDIVSNLIGAIVAFLILRK